MSDDNWAAYQHADELLRQEQILAALKVAEKHGTPRDMVITLADECGVGELYRKHTKDTT